MRTPPQREGSGKDSRGTPEPRAPYRDPFTDSMFTPVIQLSFHDDRQPVAARGAGGVTQSDGGRGRGPATIARTPAGARERRHSPTNRLGRAWCAPSKKPWH